MSREARSTERWTGRSPAVRFWAADRPELMTRICETRVIAAARSTSNQSKAGPDRPESGSREHCGPLEMVSGVFALVSLLMVGGARRVGEQQLRQHLDQVLRDRRRVPLRPSRKAEREGIGPSAKRGCVASSKL